MPGENGEAEVPEEQIDTVGYVLHQAGKKATQEIIIESAYLILTDQTMRHIHSQKERGITSLALTNSLSANNHTTAFVGYRKQRKQQIGVFSELYEYRSDASAQTELYNELAPGQDVPHFGIHAKTAVFDRNVVFIGSYNLDPRSQNLNTEIGFLVTSDALGQAVANSILGDMSPGNSWQVRQNDKGQIEWVTIVNGIETIEADNEPLSSNARKMEADLVEPFTPESEM